jgi:hypothetical protein
MRSPWPLVACVPFVARDEKVMRDEERLVPLARRHPVANEEAIPSPAGEKIAPLIQRLDSASFYVTGRGRSAA